MVQEESTVNTSEPELETAESKRLEIGNDAESFLSPRFKSAAAMAGWDEEALLMASLVVDDTPDREFRHKKRSVLQCKSPPSGSRRKRRTSTSLISIPVAVLNLEEEESDPKDDAPKQEEKAEAVPKRSSPMVEQKIGASSSSSSSSCSTLPCMDKLREELSCAICLEICFEPSTTPCGHSFCKKCLRSAADKCGKKCPKCRQLISNGRSCTINTVLWNTIQLLFPKEVETRKEAKECSSHQKKKNQDPEKTFYGSVRNHDTRPTSTLSRHGSSSSSRRRGGEITVQDEDGESISRMTRRATFSNDESRVTRTRHRSIRPVRTITRDADVRSSSRRSTPDQDQDAALALRLQREEFMEAFRDTPVQTRSSLSLARANLRAMASRATVNLRVNRRSDL